MNDQEEIKTNSTSDTGRANNASTLVQDQKSSKPPDNDIVIPEEVSNLLKPITAEAPTGQDAAASDAYFRLEMEVGKPNPNYEDWIEWAVKILGEKSKDLQVAVWLCFAWYRRDKINGLFKGICLISELLKKYSDKLLPAKPTRRAKTLLFLNMRLAKFLEKDEINTQNAKQVVDTQKIFKEIISECKQQFPDQQLNMKDFLQIIDKHAKSAQEFLIKTVEKKAEAAPTPAAPKVPPALQKAVSESAGSKEAVVAVMSEKSAVLSLKNTLRYFFEEEIDGKKIVKAPTEVFIYGMSRLLIWHNLGLPPDKDKITEIEGPNKPRQDYIGKLFANQDWDALISTIEVDFLKQPGFKYWLDAQRLVVQALEQKGSVGIKAAEEIKVQLDRLVQRIPGLAKFIFKDKQTPFADKETINWLEDEVKGISGAGKVADQILPPIMGEDYEPINKEFEAACSELPENFEKNAQAMQKGMEGDIRRKGRFLRMLNLANYCYQAKQYALARIFLNQLIEKIEAYQLTEWEPALSTAVWQSYYLTNLKLASLEGEINKSSMIEQEQEDLLRKIANYDCVLALKLSNRKLKEGE